MKSWDYVVTTHGQDAHYLLPLAVGDDGVHTHIQFSQNVRVRGLPVLQIHDASGTDSGELALGGQHPHRGRPF